MRGGILTKNAASLFRLLHHPGKGPRQNLRKNSRTPSRPSPQRPQLQAGHPKADRKRMRRTAPRSTETPQHGGAGSRQASAPDNPAVPPGRCGMRYARSVRHLRPQHAPRTRPDRCCARNIRTEAGLAATGGRSVRHRKSGRIRQPAEESELRREAARNTRWIRLATESGYERPIRTGPLSPPGRNGHRDGRRSVSPPNSAL